LVISLQFIEKKDIKEVSVAEGFYVMKKEDFQ